MTVLPAPSFPSVPGEAAGDHVVRVVRLYDGCSLSSRRSELAALVGRGVDDESMVTWATNCLTFALGVIAACQSDVPELRQHIPNGREDVALAPLVKRAGGWKPAVHGQVPPVGALMHYRSVPYRTNAAGQPINDDHYEFFLSAPDEHGGGGRPNNAITIGCSDWTSSFGRPMHEYLDPDGFGIPDANVETSENAASTIPVPDTAHHDSTPPDPDATLKPS
jgi:hypothetical protein